MQTIGLPQKLPEIAKRKKKTENICMSSDFINFYTKVLESKQIGTSTQSISISRIAYQLNLVIVYNTGKISFVQINIAC
jgi:hypothetical protein